MEGSQNGSGNLTHAQSVLRALDLVKAGWAEKEAAADLGVSPSAVQKVRLVLNRRPDFEELLRDGSMTLNAAREQAGFVTGSTNRVAVGGYFGRGDKWDESLAPITRYLVSWRKRGYEYRHVNHREAARRLRMIDTTIAELQAARADLARRAHKATTSVTAH